MNGILAKLVETSPASITVHDYAGNFLYANQKTIDLHGYSRAEFLRLNLRDLDVPESAALIQSRMEELRARGEVSFEVEHFRKDRSRIPLLVTIKRGKWAGREVILSTATDITPLKRAETLVKERTRALEVKNDALACEIAERRRAEDALRESEKIFRTLAESSPNMIFISQGGRIVYVNQRCVEVMKYAPEEFYDPRFDFMNLIAPEHWDIIQNLLRRHAAGEEVPPTEYAVINKDGTRVEAMYGSRLIHYLGKPAILGVITDITRRKRAEEALRQSEARLKDAQALGRIGNWEFDLATRKITWSEQTYKLYERDRASGPPTPEEEARYYPIGQEQKIREHARLAMEKGQGATYDLEVNLPSGKTAFFSATLQPVKDARGQVVKLFGTVQDVTERKKIELERQELLEKTLQISDLKSSLITQAAHELKTPLTPILGWGNLLLSAKQQGKNLDATFDIEDLETIVRNAERLDALINDFLDVGRIEGGKLDLVQRQVNFQEILDTARQAVDYLAVHKGTAILLETAPFPELTLDRRRMEQVLVNLLSNSIKYSPDHGRVTVRTSRVDVKGRPMLRVQVIDEGYGFTPEELAEATTPFGKAYTRQEQKRAVQGTGLGLFISRRIVEQHGGSLAIRSAGANKGTEVEILLPLGT